MKKLAFDVYSSEVYMPKYGQRFELCEAKVCEILDELKRSGQPYMSVEELFDYFEGEQVATRVRLASTQGVIDDVMEGIAYYAIENLEETKMLVDDVDTIEPLEIDDLNNIVVSKA